MWDKKEETLNVALDAAHDCQEGVTFLEHFFLRLLGLQHQGDVHRLQAAVGAKLRWLGMPSASKTSASPFRLAANAAF